eukprot:3924300-Rhodomonas_salina.2
MSRNVIINRGKRGQGEHGAGYMSYTFSKMVVTDKDKDKVVMTHMADLLAEPRIVQPLLDLL